MIHPALDAHSLTLPVALMRPRYVTELLSCGGSVVATAMARAMATAVAPLLSPLGQRCGCEVGRAVVPADPSMELRRGMGGMRWRSVYRTPLENLRQIYVGYICRQRIMRNGPRHTRRLKDIRRWNVTTIKVSLLNTRR
jgi:hypothetical protein